MNNREVDAAMAALHDALAIIRTYVEPVDVGAERFDMTDSPRVAKIIAALAMIDALAAANAVQREAA